MQKRTICPKFIATSMILSQASRKNIGIRMAPSHLDPQLDQMMGIELLGLTVYMIHWSLRVPALLSQPAKQYELPVIVPRISVQWKRV